MKIEIHFTNKETKDMRDLISEFDTENSTGIFLDKPSSISHSAFTATNVNGCTGDGPSTFTLEFSSKFTDMMFRHLKNLAGLLKGMFKFLISASEECAQEFDDDPVVEIDGTVVEHRYNPNTETFEWVPADSTDDAE